MTDFRIGDVVRLKTDGPDKLKLIVRDHDATDGQILCMSECSQRIIWASPLSCELVHRPDPQADLKQAISEVLLSDEFVAKFAAAWMKTPIPLSNPCDDKGAERVQSLADYPPGEPSEGLAIAPITGSESEAYYLDKLKKGEAK